MKNALFKPLWSPSGRLIATNYNRIERGGRGDYYEISPIHFCIKNCYIPLNKLWKLKFLTKRNPKIDYIELRTYDKVKVYYQINTQYVDYANYHIGYYYVSIKQIFRKQPTTLDSFS